MSGPIPVLPLDILQGQVGKLIEEAKTRCLPMSTLTLLSIGEYLKDAERWKYFESNLVAIPDGFTPSQIRVYIDKKIEELR